MTTLLKFKFDVHFCINFFRHFTVFVTTAANTEESSYACYYDDNRDTYLGDEYSVNWMEDSDEEDLSQETLTKQFDVVREETIDSHVMVKPSTFHRFDDGISRFRRLL